MLCLHWRHLSGDWPWISVYVLANLHGIFHAQAGCICGLPVVCCAATQWHFKGSRQDLPVAPASDTASASVNYLACYRGANATARQSHKPRCRLQVPAPQPSVHGLSILFDT